MHLVRQVVCSYRHYAIAVHGERFVVVSQAPKRKETTISLSFRKF